MGRLSHPTDALLLLSATESARTCPFERHGAFRGNSLFAGLALGRLGDNSARPARLREAQRESDA